MSDTTGSWQHLAQHDATGLQAKWRVDSVKMWANFENLVTLLFKVPETDGTSLVPLSQRMAWENSTIIKGECNTPGTGIHLFPVLHRTCRNDCFCDPRQSPTPPETTKNAGETL